MTVQNRTWLHRTRLAAFFSLLLLLLPGFPGHTGWLSLGTASQSQPILLLPSGAPPAPTVAYSRSIQAVQTPADGYLLHLPLVFSQADDQPPIPADRQAALDLYLQEYLSYTGMPINWTGSHSACDPGVTDPAFRAGVLRRINYYRAVAGVPAGITFSDASNLRAQAAALMMSANNALDHTPPSTWLCYSDLGAEGAGSANLAGGAYGWNAISLYMKDPGVNNSFTGHRRWILYPQTQHMGTGDIPYTSGYMAANALVVFDEHMWEPRPPTREEFVAWPPPGYVPYPVVYPRWSFSCPGADCSAAVVSMSSVGSALPVSLSPVVDGFGENTLVWISLGLSDGADWPKPAADTTYTVNIQNVLVDEQARSFTYGVIVFDPEH